MVVEKDSATLGYRDEISKALFADHHTVCKFESVLDSNYIHVRNALKSLVSTFRSAGKKSRVVDSIHGCPSTLVVTSSISTTYQNQEALAYLQ